VICTISGGIVEEDLPAELINEDAAAVNAVFAKESTPNELAKNTLDSAASVYPVVEVERGRVGAPTDEEMILSQRLYETVLHSGILDKDSLKVKVGLRSLNDKGEEMITYLDEDDEFGLGPKRSWRYVLYAKLKVFSRSGPLFDLVWCSLINALKDTKLPKAFIDENAADIKIPVKIRGNFGTIREQYQITCDPIENDILLLNQEAIGFASNFGIVDVDDESRETVDDEDKMELDSSSVLLIDIEGEEEETTAQKTISIVVDANGDNLKSATLIGAVDSQKLKQAIQLAKLRSKNLLR
jgi:exosome complex component RRP43